MVIPPPKARLTGKLNSPNPIFRELILFVDSSADQDVVWLYLQITLVILLFLCETILQTSIYQNGVMRKGPLSIVLTKLHFCTLIKKVNFF